MKFPFSLNPLAYLIMGVLPTGVALATSATSTTFQNPIWPWDSFQGTTGVQPSSPGAQLSDDLLTAKSNGVIVKYQIAPSVNADAATTTTNQTTSVSSTLQTGMTFATSSVYAINKATHQAGIGIAGVLSATTQTLAINYLNVSSAALTPTQEANDVIEFKAGSPLVTTATLSPAAVSLNTTAEQIFTLATSATQPVVCVPGAIAVVNKPTAQTGLGYAHMARVVGVNQVGITFAAVSSGVVTTPITPTASEAWQMAFLPQLNAMNPLYIYGIPAGQASATASTTLEETSGVTGILANDVITGISRATTQVGSGIVGARVTSAGVVGITYLQPGAAVTPTSSEVYMATVQRQAPLNPLMIYSQALATSTIAATTSAEVTSTVTGLLVSSSVIVNKPTCTPGLLVTNARVSAADTLAVEYMNLTTTAIAVPNETYLIGNVQLQGPGLGVTTTAGLFVAQSYFPAAQQSLRLGAALRAALVQLNMIAGT